ncbi:unnamed protein product [Heterobilharzia americana]|nr:unnamed protein product [Heterobilharzia americana]
MKLQAECNHKLNLVKMIKQICEGRSSCELQLSQLTPNSSQCSDENSALHVIYQCLPDPKSALFEAICTDTYMEVNCNTERSLNALVILSAKFEKEIKSSGNKLTRECPKLPIETPVGLPNTICSSRVDITDYISSSCDGRTSCSVNPNTVELPINQLNKCGKMHLSLVYVCVPPELIITEHFIDNADERHSEKQKTNQRQPKEIQSPRPGNKISSLNPSDVPIFSNEQLPYIRADIESRIKKPLTESRKPLDLQMNPRTSDNLYKNQETYVQSVNPSILQSSLIGFGGGLLILLCVLFVVLFICRRNSTRNDEMKSRQSHKPNECTSICLGHSNSDWSTMKSTTLHPVAMSDTSLSNEIKFICPGCKLPTNPCSIMADMHKYRNEDCQCRVNPNMQGNISMCNMHHDSHLDREQCYITQSNVIGHRQTSLDLYAVKMTPSTPNHSSCVFGVCPMEIQNELNKAYMPLSTHTVNSTNSRNTVNDYMPTVTSSINSIHYDYHTSPPIDPKFRSELTHSIVPNIFANNSECNLNSVNAPPSVNSSSTGRGCDGGSGMSDRSEEIAPKLNPYTGFAKIERKNDYDNVNDRRMYSNNLNSNVNCQYEIHPSKLITQSEYDGGLLRSPSNNFTNRDDCQKNYSNNNATNKPLGNHNHYIESRSLFESNTQLRPTVEQSMKSLYQVHLDGDYTTLTKEESAYHPCLVRKTSHKQQESHVDEVHPQYTHFSVNENNSTIQRCESACKESVESLSVPLIDPPQSFRTPTNKFQSTDDESTPSKLSSTQTNKPPDVILKSVNYHEDDLEQPPPKMPPLRGILTNRSVVTEKNTAF